VVHDGSIAEEEVESLGHAILALHSGTDIYDKVILAL
jgi:hypothetical protein